jgi:hypothetical protein
LQSTALAEECDIARMRDRVRKGRIQAKPWVHDAQTVGTEQSHVATLQLLGDLGFERLSC